MLVCPSVIDMSGSALRFLSRHLAERRRAIGCRWRRLSSSRQALLVLVHLRCGDTYVRLAVALRVGVTTVHRYIREAVEVLAALAPSLADAMETAAVRAFVIPDGTLLPIG